MPSQPACTSSMPTVEKSAAREGDPRERCCDELYKSYEPPNHTITYSKRKRARGTTIHIIGAAVTMSRAPDNDVSVNRQTVASRRHDFASLI
jgi:hypothetical protein